MGFVVRRIAFTTRLETKPKKGRRSDRRPGRLGGSGREVDIEVPTTRLWVDT